MTGQRTPHLRSSRKKNAIPLSKLRTVDAVKTVLDNPRRLEELLIMLEDTDRSLRGRAAAAIAQLSESHPAQLSKITERILDCLQDDSAYVRWHLVYSLCGLSAHTPGKIKSILESIIAGLDDPNGIVRIIAHKVLLRVSEQNPEIVPEYFKNIKKEIPQNVERCLQARIPQTGSKPFNP